MNMHAYLQINTHRDMDTQAQITFTSAYIVIHINKHAYTTIGPYTQVQYIYTSTHTMFHIHKRTYTKTDPYTRAKAHTSTDLYTHIRRQFLRYQLLAVLNYLSDLRFSSRWKNNIYSLNNANVVEVISVERVL